MTNREQVKTVWIRYTSEFRNQDSWKTQTQCEGDLENRPRTKSGLNKDEEGRRMQ